MTLEVVFTNIIEFFPIFRPKDNPVYRCKVCSKEFISILAVKKHVSVHLDETGKVKYLTNQVPITRYKRSCKRGTVDNSEGDYECEKCKHKFFRKKIMSMHVKACHVIKIKVSEHIWIY